MSHAPNKAPTELNEAGYLRKTSTEASSPWSKRTDSERGLPGKGIYSSYVAESDDDAERVRFHVMKRYLIEWQRST